LAFLWGHYVGALTPGAGDVQRKNRQFGALQEPVFRARLALRLSMAKVENQLRYLLRSTRPNSSEERPKEIEKGISRLRQELTGMVRLGQDLDKFDPEKGIDDSNGPITEKIEKVVEAIRGHEGMAGREYFSILPFLLNLPQEDLLYFKGRNRRPPKDPFNALLSFGYALLYKDCVAAILAVGLEPSVGFLHTPRSSAFPLALDLMEIFRVILWDIPLLGSVNRKQWKREDFDITANQVWLNSDGRRKAIQLYESRKQEKWKHPVLDYSLSYARTIELEARLLEKEWTGQPGLFAKLRLR